MIETLYGLDKKGTFKVWTIEADHRQIDGEVLASITINHGKEGGKQTEKVDLIKEGKQGRNAFEQAVSEAEGRIKKQLDKNYRHTKEELTSIPVLAMLAADYRKKGKDISYPCYGSVKYDGVRCLAKMKDGVITLESRTSQPYDLPHIVAELQAHMRDGDIWDGEIYLHGYALQDITSAVKRTDPQKEVDKAKKAYVKNDTEENEAAVIEAILVGELRDKLEFHIFDVVSDEVFEERLKVVDSLIGIEVVSQHIKVTEYFFIASEQDMKDIHHKAAVALGYEGIMLRNLKGEYESGKRSNDLQKFKTFLDSEFIILDVVPNKNDGSAFIVQNDLNDLTFSVTLGDMGFRAEALANKELYIGKLITVKYQARYKDTLLVQFPTGVAIRDYE